MHTEPRGQGGLPWRLRLNDLLGRTLIEMLLSWLADKSATGVCAGNPLLRREKIKQPNLEQRGNGQFELDLNGSSMTFVVQSNVSQHRRNRSRLNRAPVFKFDGRQTFAFCKDLGVNASEFLCVFRRAHGAKRSKREDEEGGWCGLTLS